MRAIVVSRYPVSRDGLIRLVGTISAPEDVEGFSTLEAALASAAAKPADLMVIEGAPGEPEFAMLKAAVKAVAPTPVALFAMLPPAEVEAAHESGVKGCVPKTAPPDLFIAALKLILAGGLYFSDLGDMIAKPRSEAGLRSRLSARQLEVLKLIEIGQTNKEIAKALGISVATVKLHVQAILNVTGARNRTEAALRARGQIR
jgi:DNA-binding NarL/FixJ family response regulator